MNKTSDNSYKLMHVANLLALLIAAAWSLCLMFIAGRTNKSVVLMILFTLWVGSPYVALFIITRKSILIPKQLNYLIFIITIGSVVFYTTGYLSRGKTPAFIFLLIPFISWLIIGITIMISKKTNKIKSEK